MLRPVFLEKQSVENFQVFVFVFFDEFFFFLNIRYPGVVIERILLNRGDCVTANIHGTNLSNPSNTFYKLFRVYVQRLMINDIS